MRIVLAVIVFALLTGCGKFDVATLAAPEITEAPEVCIIKNDQTKKGFAQAIESWLVREGVAYRNLGSNAPVDSCEWTLRYYGRWSWDLALFLSDAEIVAFKDGKQEGQVRLRVGQWDAYKFEKGSERVHKMMDLLSGKASEYVLPSKTK